MTYCTPTDLIERFGERMIIMLTDRGDVAAGVIDTVVVDRAIRDTAAVIGGFLGSRYDLSALTPVPELLRDLAISIAIWKLHISAPDEKIARDYKDALLMLKEMSQGLVGLEVDGKPAEATAPTTIRYTERDRPLSAATLKGYI